MVSKHFSKVLLAVFGLTSSFLAISCTRSLDHTAHISLSLPNKIKSQAALHMAQAPVVRATTSPSPSPSPSTGMADLQHVIINVTASDFKGVFAAFDSHGNAAGLGSSFDVTLPGGNGRLFQVLAVYKDANGGDAFYYGDVVADVSSDGAVVVPVAAIGASGIGEGSVAGQYVDATGLSGPTGMGTIRFTPPGKPPMVVTTFDMANGYFSTFALSGVGLDYMLPDGTTQMFGGPLDLNTHTIANAEVVFGLPALYRSHGGGITRTFEPQLPSKALIGVFGPGADLVNVNGSLRGVCYPNITIQMNSAYQDGGGVTPVTFYANSTNPADIRVVSKSSGSRVLGTSTTDSEGLCTDGNGAHSRYLDYLSVDPQRIAEQDQVLAFRGPLMASLPPGSTYRNTIDMTLSSTTVSGSFNYLPGVVTNSSYVGIYGIDIYYRIIDSKTPNAYDFESHGAGSACNTLGGLPVPFVPGAYVPANGVALTVNTSFNFNIPTALAATDMLQVLACPYMNSAKGKFYLDIAGSASYGGNFSPGGPPLATQFAMAEYIGNRADGSSGTINLANGVCSPVYIIGLDSATPVPNMAELPIMNTANVILTAGSANFGVYYDGYCTNTTGPAMYTMGGSPYGGLLVYIKRTGTGNYSDTVGVNDVPDNLGTANIALNFYDVPGSSSEILAMRVPPQITAYNCYEVDATTYLHDNSFVVPDLLAPWPTNHSIQMPSVPNLTYYYDPMCSNPTGSSPSITLDSMHMTFSSYTGIYFTYVGAATSLDLTPTLGAPTFTGTIVGGANSIMVTQPGAPAMLMAMPQGSTNYNACVRIDIMLTDSYGQATPATTTASVSVNATLGQFYTDNSCMTPFGLSMTATLSVGQTYTSVYYMSASPGPETINTSTTSFGSISGTDSFTVF